MMSKFIVASTTEGEGGDHREKHTIKATFRNFLQLPNERGVSVRSSLMKCHGEQWYFGVFPGGEEDSKDGYVACYLVCESARKNGYDVLIDWTMYLNGRKYDEYKNDNLGKGGQGWPDFCRRDVFANGESLHIEATIQLCFKPDQIWLPKNKIDQVMLKYLDGAKATGDMTFRIGERDFAAHRGLLELRVPTLVSLCDSEVESPILLDDVDPKAFERLLCFAYANAVPKPEDLDANAAEMLLIVADKMNCTDLKLHAEAAIVRSWISVDTVADLILKADSMNCALLKEKTIEFYVKNAPAVMKTEGWERAVKSTEILRELLEVSMGGTATSEAQEGDDERDYDGMSVSALRRKLDEKGQCVDGSKKMLIERLREFDAAKTSAEGTPTEGNAEGAEIANDA